MGKKSKKALKKLFRKKFENLLFIKTKKTLEIIQQNDIRNTFIFPGHLIEEVPDTEGSDNFLRISRPVLICKPNNIGVYVSENRHNAFYSSSGTSMINKTYGLTENMWLPTLGVLKNNGDYELFFKENAKSGYITKKGSVYSQFITGLHAHFYACFRNFVFMYNLLKNRFQNRFFTEYNELDSYYLNLFNFNEELCDLFLTRKKRETEKLLGKEINIMIRPEINTEQYQIWKNKIVSICIEVIFTYFGDWTDLQVSASIGGIFWDIFSNLREFVLNNELISGFFEKTKISSNSDLLSKILKRNVPVQKINYHIQKKIKEYQRDLLTYTINNNQNICNTLINYHTTVFNSINEYSQNIDIPNYINNKIKLYIYNYFIEKLQIEKEMILNNNLTDIIELSYEKRKYNNPYTVEDITQLLDRIRKQLQIML
jgi:hypothetical protein